MQEEVTQKSIALVIRTSKLTADVLKKAMIAYLNHLKNKQANWHGKISVKKLMGKDQGANTMEITENNIKSFERVAKKYGIDFSLKKDVNADPPRYYVFFKARDADVMTAAFREYTGKSLNKDKKPSVRKKLQQAISKSLKKHRELEKTKGKEKEPSL